MKKIWIYSSAMGLLLMAAVLPADAEYRNFKNTAGKRLIARVISKNGNKVVLERQKDRRTFTLDVATLSEADQSYLRSWEPGAWAENESGGDKGSMSKKLYSKTKEEIEETITAIRARSLPEGVTKDQFAGVTELNIYRYLCGLSDDVKSDRDLNAEAQMASEACEKNGALSHTIGSFTDKCNLCGPGLVGIKESFRWYMLDSGAKNRAHRGHRAYCLNPMMGKTGFGWSGGYSAMWALDSSSHSRLDFWSYPGSGLFPADYVHSNSWSAYFADGAPNAETVNIEVFKLDRRPENPLKSREEPFGKSLRILYKNTDPLASKALNFEVEYENGEKKGIYWVRILGGGAREAYLVELY